MALISSPSVSGVQDSQGWLELAPATLSYLAMDLIGGQLSRPTGKQTRPLGPQDVPCGRRGAGDLPRVKHPAPPGEALHASGTCRGLPGCMERTQAARPGASRQVLRRGISLGLLCTQPGSLRSWRVPGTEENKGDPEPGRGPVEEESVTRLFQPLVWVSVPKPYSTNHPGPGLP